MGNRFGRRQTDVAQLSDVMVDTRAQTASETAMGHFPSCAQIRLAGLGLRVHYAS